jgi:polyhydroxybutyrate depolymerase
VELARGAPEAVTRALLALLAAGCGATLRATDGGADAPAPDLEAPVDAAPADTAIPVDAARRPDLTTRDFAQVFVDLGGDSAVNLRPYHFQVPTGYDSSRPTPLVILLHGYTATGATQEAYFQLAPVADARGFLYAWPDGTVDATGQHFWNADDACCDIYGANPDDVGYVNQIVDDMSTRFNVDPKRVYLVGHSNGAFMAHRMACDAAPRFAAIVALAGAVWNDPSLCQPSTRVSVLAVHGDLDAVVNYNGGQTPNFAGGLLSGRTYPSAHGTVATWSAKNGCSGAIAATGQTLDLDTVLVGPETKIEAYAGCPAGGSVELWTIQGGGHLPAFAQPTWPDAVWSWLDEHPKP